MAKAPFTKGQKVTLVTEWNHENVVCRMVNAVVYSCGQKRMVLMTADGSKCLGRDFKPYEMAAPLGENRYMQRVYDGHDRADAAQAFADWYREDVLKGYHKRASLAGANSTYRKSMEEIAAHVEATPATVVVTDH